ncbi:MAG TPA: hypothetical protein VN461_02295 [Vicinamibacteria bacterium]|nr:hypothetical protein [Vicinamibacteria bacterium]
MTVIARGGRGALLVAASLTSACFQVQTMEGPSPVSVPRLVSVRLEYRQPAGCVAVIPSNVALCENPVVFFGSWMRQPPPGIQAGVLLTLTPGTLTWSGTVTGVPANFPPRDEPYFVRVYDPHLVETASGGVAASRLIVGGQVITAFDSAGTPSESGLIYIDDNGQGHTPF